MVVNDPRWRLEVDASACDGHGMCALILPERVALDEWGFALVSGDPLAGEKLVKRSRRAVAACPNRALVLRSVV